MSDAFLRDDGGIAYNMLPTLRITFSELEGRSKILERTRTESKRQIISRGVKNQASKEDIVQEKFEGRGVFHLKPAFIPETPNRWDKKRPIKSPDKSQNINSVSAFEQTSVKNLVRKQREADVSTDVPRYFPKSSCGGSSCMYPLMQEIKTSSAERRTKTIGYDKRRKEEVDRRSPRSCQLRSKSFGDQPRSGDATVKIELMELTEEWDSLESKGVEWILTRWNGDIAKLDPIFEMCHKMTGCAEKILSKDVHLFCKLNITSKLWKEALYPVLDVLRERCSSGVEGCRDLLTRFLDSTVEFYSRSLQIVQTKFCFRISDLTSGKIQFTSKTQHRGVMLAAVMCHNWYVYLGDLVRYQQQLLVSAGAEADWTKSRQCYVRAQQLAPKDGKPYNQLAVIALNTHRRLDAVYYYMRSLATSRPFQSAYDSLVAIFAETGRKAQRQEEDERMDRETEKARFSRKQRKEDQMLKKKKQLRRKQSKREGGKGGGGSVVNEFSSGKKEIWILPGMVIEDGGVQVQTGASCDPLALEVESCLVPSPQVVKKVTSAFLVVHGKLFTKTGRESLEPTVLRLLVHLGRLLRVEVRQGDALLFLKMAVINIYSIHHAVESNAVEESQREGACFHSSLALRLSLQMTELMLETCVERLDEHEPSSKKKKKQPQFAQSDPYVSGKDLESWHIGDCDDAEPVGGGGRGGKSNMDQILDFFSVVLPAVRVVFDWFLCREELCAKSVLDRTLLLKFWTTTVSFLNKSRFLFSVNGQSGAEREEDAEGREGGIPPRPPNLWEDRALAGFMPLKADLGTMDTFALPQYKMMNSKQHREQSLARILLLENFCRRLCGKPHITGATVGYNAVSGEFLVVSEGSFKEVKSGGGEREGERDDEDLVEMDNSLSFGYSGDDESDVIMEFSDEEEDEEDEGKGLEEEGWRCDVTSEEEVDALEIEQLKAQRDGLAKQLEERTLAMAMAKTVLSDAASKVGEEMQIIPKYLVPDTNCFVDMLPSIKKLVQRADFILGIPLTVVVELEGLSKRTATNSDKKSATSVASGAKNALDYIMSSFESKSPHLRALTTQGSLLSTLSFRAEITEQASNDDLILESCLQLHLKTKASAKTGEGVCYKVVLLTDDRNLRVKAHASRQPVKDIPSFMMMLS